MVQDDVPFDDDDEDISDSCYGDDEEDYPEACTSCGRMEDWCICNEAAY